jgi:hypothetical protein
MTIPYSAENENVVRIRHALAIDERRSAFRPNFFLGRVLGKTALKCGSLAIILTLVAAIEMKRPVSQELRFCGCFAKQRMQG